MSLPESLQRAAAALRATDALLITAGAGMGVDSGLPDFRGPEGFWRAYPALGRRGLSFESMAQPRWFSEDPHLAWAFYGHRLHLYRKTKPHPGFDLLRHLASTHSAGSFVVTSNVDGQFQKAGFDLGRIVECHGSIHHLQCARGCTENLWPADGLEVCVDEERFRAEEPLPRCPECGGIARPNILMFGDHDWLGHRTDAQEARWNHWLRGIQSSSARLVIVELGAGQAVPTIRRTSERVADALDGLLIRINPREPSVPVGHLSLPMGAAEALDRLRALLF